MPIKIRRAAPIVLTALALGIAAIPVVHALRGPGRIQNVGLLTAQVSRSNGYNQFLVTVGGPGAPRPQNQNLDPILWQQGWSRNAYLTNLDALEAKGLVVQVYTQPDGTIRARLADEPQAARQAQVQLVRQAMNTPAPAQAVKALAANPGIHSVAWLTPGLVSVQTHHSAAWVSNLAGVTSVAADPQIPVQSVAAPNNWAFMDQWDLKNTGQSTPGISGSGTPGADANVLSAWSATQGQGVTVAVLDMGVVQPLQGLAQINGTNIQQAPNYTFVPNQPGAVADTSKCASGTLSSGNCESLHGTWVTGVIDAATNSGSALAGIAPGANMLEEVVGTNGSVDVGSAVSAIYYALDHGAKILNLSWGGTGNFTGVSTLEAAIQQANTDGALVVAAAGNSGQNNNPTSSNPASNGNPDTIYPASLAEPNIISVGASTPTNTKASFSNYGSNSVSLFAPGDQLLTTSYDQMSAYVSGTSLAAPVVSAAAALVWSVHPTWTPEQVKADLMSTVTKVPALNGYAEAPGVVNIGAAVSAAESGAMTTTFTGFNTLSAGAKGTTSVKVAVPAAASASGNFDLRLSFAIDTGNQIAAAGGVPVSYTEGSTSGTATTDAAGVLTIPAPTNLASGSTVQLGLDLPWSGKWGMAVAVVPAGDPTTASTLGSRAVYFNVGGNSPAPAPTAPTAPSGGTTTTSPTAPPPSSGTSTGGGTTGGTSSGTTTSPTPTPGTSTGTTTGSTPSSGTSSGTTTPSSGSSSGTSSGGTGGSTGGQLQVTPPSQVIPPSSPTSSPTPVPNPTPVGNTGGSSPGGSTGTTPSSGTSTGTSSGGSTGTTPSPGTSTGGGGGSLVSPTGVFGLQSVQPNVVSTAGGTQVTVYGTAIPSGASVLIGGQPATMVTSNAPASLAVIAPPAVAGPESVKVVAPDGTSQTMTNAVTYQAPSASNGTPSSGTSTGGGTTPGTNTGTTAPSTGTGTSPSSGTSTSGGTTGGISSGTTTSPTPGTSTSGGGTPTSTPPAPGSSTPSSPTAPNYYGATPGTPTAYTMPNSSQADSDLAGSYPALWGMFQTAGSSSSGYAV